MRLHDGYGGVLGPLTHIKCVTADNVILDKN